MASDTIQVEYDQVREVGRRFEQQAETCQELQQRLQERVDELENGGWSGEASAAFFDTINHDVFPALKRLAVGFEQANLATKQIAQIFRDAEENTKGQINTGDIPPALQDTTEKTWLQDVSGKDDQRDQLYSEIKRKPSDKVMRSAQQFNNKEGYSVDFVRRLEKTFGLPHSQAGENGQFSEELVTQIVRYQESKGLKGDDLDGKVGEQTLTLLRKDYPDVFVDRLKGSGQVGREIISPNATEAERYDHYKSVVEGNYGVWRDGPGEVNIVGVRGMEDGKQVINKVGRSNDTMAVIWTDSEGNKHVKEFRGSVDPGVIGKRMNEKGVAHVKDGSYVYKLEQHYPKEKHVNTLKGRINQLPEGERAVEFSKGGYTALRQKSPVTVYRDRDLKGQKGHGYIEADEMVEDRGMFGINMHYSGKKNPWSQGCQVIAGAKEYNDFISTIKNGTNTDAIPYNVIDASKL